MTTIGQRLYELRGDLTQEDVARAAGMAGSHYNRIECDAVTPRLFTLAKLAIALNITVAKMLTDVEIPLEG